MLVLSRRCGEEIVIGGNVRVVVISVKGERVRLGITAPDSVSVDRLEVRERRFAPADDLVPERTGSVLPDLVADLVHQ
jgi:carbon storage regulator